MSFNIFNNFLNLNCLFPNTEETAQSQSSESYAFVFYPFICFFPEMTENEPANQDLSKRDFRVVTESSIPTSALTTTPLRFEQIEQITAPEASQNSPFVEWVIDIESFRKVDPAFAEMILESQRHYKNIWNNMSQDLVLKSVKPDEVANLSIRSIKDLRQYYHVWYQMQEGHLCLMSAFCALTMTDSSQFKGENIKKIHHAMANHLDKPEIARQFESDIRREHRKSVQEYQQFLRQPAIRQFLGELEMGIFASLMGVKVTCLSLDYFGFGIEVDPSGLPRPAVQMNSGPETKECLYIVHETTNYYYTFPKLKTGVLTGAAEESVNTMERYWTTIRHNYY